MNFTKNLMLMLLLFFMVSGVRGQEELNPISDKIETWESPTKEEISNKHHSFPRMEWDVLKIGVSSPKGSDGGMLFDTEFRYFVSHKSAFSLKLEGTIQDGISVPRIVFSAAGFMDYIHPTTENTDIFAGAGVSTYYGFNPYFDGMTGLGIVPRIGFRYGMLRFSSEYNILLTGGLSSYFSIKAGVTISNNCKYEQKPPNKL